MYVNVSRRCAEEKVDYGDKMPDKFYSYNAYEHGGDYTFTGVPGVKYRAVMKAYAEDENGSEYSKEFTCTGRVCK